MLVMWTEWHTTYFISKGSNLRDLLGFPTSLHACCKWWKLDGLDRNCKQSTQSPTAAYSLPKSNGKARAKTTKTGSFTLTRDPTRPKSLTRWPEDPVPILSRMINCDVGCGSGPACDPLLYYVYFREVTCSAWIAEQHQWIPGNCQVVLL